MSKQVALIHGSQIMDLTILPGTTAQDVLVQAGLSKDLALSKRDGLFFGATEEIYDAVDDGTKLHASAPAIVGQA